MYSPRFVLRSFEHLSDGAKLGVLLALLDALIKANVAYLTEVPETPGLFASGVRYAYEPVGREDWQDIPETLARGTGDCEDLACWRVAELRVRERDHAVPLIRKRVHQGRTLYHIAVHRQDGQLEDPSRLLGMGRVPRVA